MIFQNRGEKEVQNARKGIKTWYFEGYCFSFSQCVSWPIFPNYWCGDVRPSGPSVNGWLRHFPHWTSFLSFSISGIRGSEKRAVFFFLPQKLGVSSTIYFWLSSPSVVWRYIHKLAKIEGFGERAAADLSQQHVCVSCVLEQTPAWWIKFPDHIPFMQISNRKFQWLCAWRGNLRLSDSTWWHFALCLGI